MGKSGQVIVVHLDDKTRLGQLNQDIVARAAAGLVVGHEKVAVIVVVVVEFPFHTV